jgi:ketol-acid reductoisomerase
MEREMFLQGFGVPALIAVEQNHSGEAKKIALALAKGLGATKAGVIETTFTEEATSDLFGEQAVLCGGVTALIEAGFDTLVKAGYQPEIAYFECLHEVKLIVDLIQKGGMMHMWTSVSNTAEYGGLSRRDRLITADTRKEMAKMLKEIQEGKFAKEWMKDAKSGMKKIQKMEDEEASSHIEVVGKEIRSLFEFQAPKKVKKTVAKKPVKKAAAKAKPKKPVVKPKAKKTVAKKPAAKRPAPKKK